VGQRGGIKSSPKNLYPSKELGALKQKELGSKPHLINRSNNIVA
jgi:hypothetical protein